MIVALLVLAPLTAVAAWAFWRFSPANGNRRAVLRFNALSVLVALLLVVAWIARTYVVMSPTVDSAWWPIMSTLGALAIVPGALGLAAVVRNLVLFRRRAERSAQ